jgi:hypothetical protein
VIDLTRPKARVDESLERLRAAEPIEEEPAPNTLESGPPPADMSDVDDLLSSEPESEVEPAPSSSPRPVGPAPAEKLAQMAFGDESSPSLHTPPPESGRLPAVQQSDLDFDADVTGVREAPKGAPPRQEPLLLELVPEVTAPVVTASAPVAEVVSDAARFKPQTFGDLLEATLSL